MRFMLDLDTRLFERSDWLALWRRWSVRTPSIALLPVQLFLAAGWARAGVEKLIDPHWWDGRKLLDFLALQRPHMLPFFVWFTDVLVAPIVVVVAGAVMVSQFAIAGCLAANRFVRPALWGGVMLNVAFTLSGRVNPSAFYLVMQLALLFALSRPISMVIARRRATLWLMVAAFILPFARTLHPALVIDDPALMLAFVAGLAAMTGVAMAADRGTPAPYESRSSRVGEGTVSRPVPAGAMRSRDPLD